MRAIHQDMRQAWPIRDSNWSQTIREREAVESEDQEDDDDGLTAVPLLFSKAIVLCPWYLYEIEG